MKPIRVEDFIIKYIVYLGNECVGIMYEKLHAELLEIMPVIEEIVYAVKDKNYAKYYNRLNNVRRIFSKHLIPELVELSKGAKIIHTTCPTFNKYIELIPDVANYVATIVDGNYSYNEIDALEEDLRTKFTSLEGEKHE